ncbi:MAG: bifunctional metallophosphatase/5'-nucleotidase [Rhizobiales bacterium]|nr:bifunctional metallophosphatase/5'-nucleotidase [Hyphomicrobiales bacterium]
MSARIRLRLSVLALASLLSTAALAETVTLRFVQTNDIDRMQEEKGRGGFARLAAVIGAERAEGPTFFVHSGDTLSPSLLSGIDKGAHIIDILNQMGVDAMTPGNHEFDFGKDNFHDRIAEAKFPVLTSNMREADGSQPPGTLDERIVDVDGIKIAFYGLTTEDTPIVSSPGDMVFKSSIETAKAKAKALREAGADLVVAVVHTPLPVDIALVRAHAADLVFSGHDEHLMTFYDGKTVLTESGSQADDIVVTRVTVDKEVKDGKMRVTWRPAFDIVDSASVTPDPKIAAVVKAYQDKLDTALKVDIGTTTTPLDSRRATVRGDEAAIGDLFADAMRAAVGADVAITNGGGIRADREYPAGTVLTRADIFAELPFGNKTVKLSVTGEQLRAALVNGFSQADQGAGRFPQVSGLTVDVDLSKPPRERVLTIKVGDKPLDLSATYTLATNDFMANGGDGYAVLREAGQLIGPIDAQLMASQVIDYIAAKKTIAPTVEGRIRPAP